MMWLKNRSYGKAGVCRITTNHKWFYLCLCAGDDVFYLSIGTFFWHIFLEPLNKLWWNFNSMDVCLQLIYVWRQSESIWWPQMIKDKKKSCNSVNSIDIEVKLAEEVAESHAQHIFWVRLLAILHNIAQYVFFKVYPKPLHLFVLKGLWHAYPYNKTKKSNKTFLYLRNSLIYMILSIMSHMGVFFILFF